MDFPRFQILFFAAILLVVTAIFLDLESILSILLLGLTVLCLLYQLWWIIPYTPLWPREVKPSTDRAIDRKLSILTSNVLAPNRNAAALIDLVNEYQPDILVTLESDQWWQDQLKVLEDEMPHTIQCPLDNLYGMHLYSRLPLHDGEISFLVEEGVPSIHVSVELRSGDRVRAHFLHPAPPSPTENEESTERDAELIIVARSISDSSQPVVIAGDLNDVAWSFTTRLFRKISGLLDPRIGRGMFNTFHAGYPLMRWPLDHLFHSHHFTVRTIKRLPSIGSDHFPLFASLTFTPDQKSHEEGLTAETEDKERAVEITRKKQVSKEDVPEPGE
ncbi:endonuclease/exonuclease/phosphatase family protein [Cryomorphaceae bacterium 1068]|nr:endonuclease/exonuclease/phosphatase family protein [Cryomorphaceae bacterium 1068]